MRRVVARLRQRWFPTGQADRTSWRRVAWRARATAYRVVVGRPLAAWRQPPGVIVIGAQRSGTTSLFRLLQGHPDVVWPLWIKSPHWFDVNFNRSKSWYLSHFPLRARLRRRGRSRITGEAAPYYLFHPHVARRIASELPHVRVVAILRDPVRRAWSHYQHEVARGFEALPVVEALRKEEERIRTEIHSLQDPSFTAHHHRHHSYVSRGHYAEQLERYYAMFPAEQVLVLFTRELEDDPQGTADRLTSFLGIAPLRVEGPSRHHARKYDPLPEPARTILSRAFDEHDDRLEDLLGRAVPWRSS